MDLIQIGIVIFIHVKKNSRKLFFEFKEEAYSLGLQSVLRIIDKNGIKIKIKEEDVGKEDLLRLLYKLKDIGIPSSTEVKKE